MVIDRPDEDSNKKNKDKDSIFSFKDNTESSNIQLTLEQQFEHIKFSGLAKQMSREQAINFLIRMHKYTLAKERTYKMMLDTKLGLNNE